MNGKGVLENCEQSGAIMMNDGLHPIFLPRTEPPLVIIEPPAERVPAETKSAPIELGDVRALVDDAIKEFAPKALEAISRQNEEFLQNKEKTKLADVRKELTESKVVDALKKIEIFLGEHPELIKETVLTHPPERITPEEARQTLLAYEKAMPTVDEETRTRFIDTVMQRVDNGDAIRAKLLTAAKLLKGS